MQYHVLPGRYLRQPTNLTITFLRLTRFVFDVNTVPKMKLDDNLRKDDIAVQVKTELSDIMEQFGYGIVKALVTDIEPDTKVREAMNQSMKHNVCALPLTSAVKLKNSKVKAAEAEARSTELQGGMANQRKALIDGLKDSIADFKDAIAGTDSNAVMNLVLLTQYFDTLKTMGENGANTVLTSYPRWTKDFADQMRNAMITANLSTGEKKC